MKLVQESDKSLDPPMFQQSPMRRSCMTFQLVLVVLDVSKKFNGIENDSSLGEKRLTLGST